VSALALVAILALAVTAAVLRTGGEAAPRPPALAPLPLAPAPHARVFAPMRVTSGQGIATGFALGDGRVVTVAHVVDGPVTVRGRRVRVLRVDRRSDLALLSAPSGSSPGGDPPRTRGGAPDLVGAPDLASARTGEHLRVLRLRDGARSSLSVHVRRSIVAHVSAPGAARAVVRPAIELSARVTPGDSGAPVVTDSGALAGVVFASSRNRRDTAYAVDASALAGLIDRP
jgi:S1-C subfamily serine protease